MQILRLVTCSLLPLMALLWVPSSNGADGAAKSGPNLNIPVACGCTLQDEIDLKSRIKSLNAVITEFHAQKSPYSGSKQKLTPAIRSTVSNAVKQKLNDAKDSKAKDYGATTYDIGCFTMIDFSATPCLRGALDDHESIHRAACDAHDSSDWRYGQLVEDWIQEEIDAYEKELKRLNDELNKRLPFCTLDPSDQATLRSIAMEKQREQESKERLDWFLGLFN